MKFQNFYFLFIIHLNTPKKKCVMYFILTFLYEERIDKSR